MNSGASLTISLRDMRVLVTGASRGIGFYVAQGLAEMGARIAIASRSRELLERAAREIGEEKTIAIQADLTRREDLESLLDKAYTALGGLDALVFNIGNTSCEPCLLHEAGYDDWVESAARHLVAPGFLASKYISMLLSRRERGVLVFLSSASIREPMKYFALADASRAGLVQLAKAIARYYGGNGIRAYTILLGSFDTPGARYNLSKIAKRIGISFEEIWRREVLDKTPLHRVASPDELATLVAFLLTKHAEYMNGSTIVFDGAMTSTAC